MLNESRNNSMRSNMKRYCSCRERQRPGSHSSWSAHLNVQAYHSEHTAWFLDAECLHHLEHIHNALCLAAFSGIDQRTEHPTPTHRVTACGRSVCVCVCVCVHSSTEIAEYEPAFTTLYLHVQDGRRTQPMQFAHLPWTTMGLFPVLLCITNTCSMMSMMARGEVHRPSGVQHDIWN